MQSEHTTPGAASEQTSQMPSAMKASGGVPHGLESIQPIIDTLTDAIIIAHEDNRIMYANVQVQDLLGWDPELLRDVPLVRLVPERLREKHLEAFSRVVAGEPPRLLGRQTRMPALRADGSEVTVELTINALTLPLGGQLFIGTLRDAREQMRIERHVQVADQLLEILGQEWTSEQVAQRLLAAIGETLDWQVSVLWALNEEGHLRCHHFWQAQGGECRRFEALTMTTSLPARDGLPGRAVQTGAPAWIADLAADEDGRLGVGAAEGLRCGLAFPITAGPRVLGAIELFSTERRELADVALGPMETVGGRLGEFLVRLGVDRERDRLIGDLAMAKQTSEFLLKVNRVVAEAAGFRDTLERLATIAVPVLGDICVIDVLEEDGAVRRIAARHADPARQVLVDELERDYALDSFGEDHPATSVLRSRVPALVSETPVELLREMARDARHLQLITLLGYTSYMCVPLVVGSRTLGVVSLVSAGSGRRFSESDLALAQDLAAQVASVVDKARASDVEQRAALTLQYSLLPHALPAVPGVTTAARYVPWAETAEIGGDWYDVVQLAEGRVGFAVGDVEGHDMQAAALMGRLRPALRAYLLEGHRPPAALELLNGFSTRLAPGRLTTICCGVLDPETGLFEVASAGHYPPLITGRGEAELLTFQAGPPIGHPNSRYESFTGELDSGSALVFFTDGMVKSRSLGEDVAMDRLVQTVRAAGTDVDVLCQELEGAAPSGRARGDDVVVLALRRDPIEP